MQSTDGDDKLMKRIASILLSVAFLVAGISFAKEAPKANAFTKTLSAVTAAELPAKAAELVSQAKKSDRQATTISVVKAALGINPAAAPAIVGAIARAVPEMAAIAASTAAAEQPKQVVAIAKAAAAGAPSQISAIVKATCRAVPNEYQNIAMAVSQVVPGSGNEVLKGVAAAFPEMKPSIEGMMAGHGTSATSVAVVLGQAATVKAAPATTIPILLSQPTGSPVAGSPAIIVRGPASGPPYIPLGGTPTNVNSGASGEVPGGGRNYAAP